jgi:multicomponent Na+:H+ antiporter subunit B
VTSLIFATATRVIQPLMLLYSLFLLVSGHDEPGGGFAGGLVAAAAFTLHAIAYDVEQARRALRVHPLSLVGAGLLVALASGVPALLEGRAFLTSRWTAIRLPAFGEVDVGTPLLFDTGVFLVVMGVTLTFVLSLAEE